MSTTNNEFKSDWKSVKKQTNLTTDLPYGFWTTTSKSPTDQESQGF